MAIASGDIVFRHSGGSANSDPLLSLGGAKSSFSAAATIFDKVDGDESDVGDVEFRCIYVRNNHGSLTLRNAVAWVSSDTPQEKTRIELGLGSSLLNEVEQTVATEGSAPAGVAFLPAATKSGGIALGNIPPGQTRAVWLRRTVLAATAAAADDPFTIIVEGETDA